jgi:hypothetical protein
MIHGLLERSVSRLGPRYPVRAIFLALVLNEVVILVAGRHPAAPPRYV